MTVVGAEYGLEALDGRIENDAEKVAQSGIIQVEEELEKFLVHERGRNKILRSAREVQTVIFRVRHTLVDLTYMINNRDELDSIQKQLDAIDNAVYTLIAELEGAIN